MTAQTSGPAAPSGAQLSLGSSRERFVRQVTTPINCVQPQDVATYCLERLFAGSVEAIEQEELWVLLLNRKNRLTHEVLLYRGTQSQCQVRVAELFREAVRLGASAIIVVHCHPSGDPTPSPEDVHITRQAREAGDLLDVDLLDHLILGHGRWVSLRERGLGWT